MRLIFVTIAACLALGLAACGGDDEETTLPVPTATGPTGATGATGAEGAAGSGSAVEEAITDAGFGIESVTCPDEVPLEKQGDEFNCDFVQDDQEGTLTVTVDSADEQSATISYRGSAGDIDVEGSGVDVKK
jgi:Domain of unknown function (DUF4333)